MQPEISASEPAASSPLQPRATAGRAASRRRILGGLFILLCGVLSATLVAAIGLALPPKYKANAQLLVDPRDLQVLDNQVATQPGAQNIGTTLVETQALVMSSEQLLRAVIKKLDLAADPDFNGTAVDPVKRLLARVRALLPVTEQQPDLNTEAVVLDALQRALNVYRVDRTYVIDASVTALSREKARTVLEAVVNEFLAYQSTSRSEIARRAKDEVGAGIDELKQNVAVLEKEVARYKEQNDLISARGQSISEQQLTDLNTKLITARVETEKLRARLRSTPRRAADLDSVPEAVTSPTLRDLRLLMARGNERKAEVAAQLLPSHPAMRSIAESGRRVRTEINQELSRIRNAIAIDYDRAKANEAALDGKLDGLRDQITMANQAGIKLRELEGKLDAARAVYARALARSTEANEQIRVSTANIRLIAEPHALPNRTFPPPVPLLAAIGFVFGLVAAYMLLHILSFARRPRHEAPV